MSKLIVKELDAPTGSNITAPDLALPSGSVINTEYRNVTPPSSPIQTTSTSYTNAFSETYTPVSSNSTVIFQLSTNTSSWATQQEGRHHFKILLDGVEQYTVVEQGGYDYGGSGIWTKWHSVFVAQKTSHSGNAITFLAQFAVPNTSVYARVREATNGGRHDLIITEVAQ